MTRQRRQVEARECDDDAHLGHPLLTPKSSCTGLHCLLAVAPDEVHTSGKVEMRTVQRTGSTGYSASLGGDTRCSAELLNSLSLAHLEACGFRCSHTVVVQLRQLPLPQVHLRHLSQRRGQHEAEGDLQHRTSESTGSTCGATSWWCKHPTDDEPVITKYTRGQFTKQQQTHVQRAACEDIALKKSGGRFHAHPCVDEADGFFLPQNVRRLFPNVAKKVLHPLEGPVGADLYRHGFACLDIF